MNPTHFEEEMELMNSNIKQLPEIRIEYLKRHRESYYTQQERFCLGADDQEALNGIEDELLQLETLDKIEKLGL
jgi:hypothetical protein